MADISTADLPSASRLGILRPTVTQELLLVAAFASDADFPEAWQAWCASLQGQEPLPDDYVLLQLLVPRIRDLPQDAAYVQLCRAQYRVTWAKGMIMSRMAESVIGVLDDAGIRTILLKGAALSPAYYQDHGLRGFGDVDILVAPGDIASAMQVLERAGWQQKFAGERYDSRFFHSVTLENDRGGIVDLHAHVQHLNSADEDDDRFWAKAQPFALGSRQALTIAPAHQLVHQIAHAWGDLPNPRWIADCLTIMRVAEIDWPELVEMSRRLQLTSIVQPALHYLRGRFGVAVPQFVLDDLAAVRTSLVRRRQLRRIGMSRTSYVHSLEWHFWRLSAGARHNPIKVLALAPAYFTYLVTTGGNRGLADMVGKWFARHSVRFR